jgi:hypothetical protein
LDDNINFEFSSDKKTLKISSVKKGHEGSYVCFGSNSLKTIQKSFSVEVDVKPNWRQGS